MDRKPSASSVEEIEASGGRDSGHGGAPPTETSSSNSNSGANKSSASIDDPDLGIDIKEIVTQIEIQNIIGVRPEFWMNVNIDDDFSGWFDMR